MLPGTYAEPVIITKSVTLLAENNGAILQNQQTAMLVTVADVTISGFTFQGNTVGLQANNASNLTVTNNLFQQNGKALHLNASQGLIANNIIRENTGDVAGIYAAGEITIAFNTIIDNVPDAACNTACAGGIYAWDGHVTIEGNILWNNGTEIGVNTGTPTVRANLIDDATYAGQNDNINLMPLFSDTGTLRPGGGSPVIDAIPEGIGGSYLAKIERDRLGTLRPQDGNTDGRIKLDMGALEALPQTSLLNVEITPMPVPTMLVTTPIVIPTQTMTPIVTSTATAEPSVTLTPMPASATPTASPSATLQPSLTPSPTAILAPTLTASATLAPSLTPSPTTGP